MQTMAQAANTEELEKTLPSVRCPRWADKAKPPADHPTRVNLSAISKMEERSQVSPHHHHFMHVTMKIRRQKPLLFAKTTKTRKEPSKTLKGGRKIAAAICNPSCGEWNLLEVQCRTKNKNLGRRWELDAIIANPQPIKRRKYARVGIFFAEAWYDGRLMNHLGGIY